VVVLGAIAILARASFDTEDPTLRAQQAARRSTGNGSEDRAPERIVATAASEPVRVARAAEPAPGARHRGGSGSEEAFADPAGSAAAPQAAASPAPAPPAAASTSPSASPSSSNNSSSNNSSSNNSTSNSSSSSASSSARTHASRSSSSPSPSKETHSGATSAGAGGASGTAAKAGGKNGGKNGVDGAGGAPGTKKPDPKLALADAKKDGAWQRPPFGEDANSRLVAHFTQAGGAVLKGRVIDADSGKPSAGVTIETHVGDVFMRSVTDAAGNFRMTNIFTNRRLTVWLIGRSDAFVAERLELTSPADGDTLDAGVVRLLRGDELASHLEGWMGMFVTRRGRRNVVAAVSPWSPADRAGIQVGDVLLSIEGRDVGGLGPRAASFLLRGPVGSKSTVALQNHDGTVVRYQLERVLR
jgi:hypothetical protein